jgi:hypothetical protein
MVSGVLSGPVVLQLQRIADITRPPALASTTTQQAGGPRLFLLELTDGKVGG